MLIASMLLQHRHTCDHVRRVFHLEPNKLCAKPIDGTIFDLCIRIGCDGYTHATRHWFRWGFLGLNARITGQFPAISA